MSPDVGHRHFGREGFECEQAKRKQGALRVTCRQAGRSWVALNESERPSRHSWARWPPREREREGGRAAVTQRLSIKICWRKGVRVRGAEKRGRNGVEQ